MASPSAELVLALQTSADTWVTVDEEGAAVDADCGVVRGAVRCSPQYGDVGGPAVEDTSPLTKTPCPDAESLRRRACSRSKKLLALHDDDGDAGSASMGDEGACTNWGDAGSDTGGDRGASSALELSTCSSSSQPASSACLTSSCTSSSVVISPSSFSDSMGCSVLHDTCSSSSATTCLTGRGGGGLGGSIEFA